MKKILMFLFLFISVFALNACKNTNPDLSESRIVKTDFVSNSNEYKINNNKVDLYYDAEDLNPYIDIKEFFNLLSGVYYSNDMEFLASSDNNKLKISYEVNFGNDQFETYEANLDFELDTLEVASENFFDYYIVYPETDYGEGLINLPSIMMPGTSIKYELGKYNFDLKYQDNKHLVPLSIANLLFNQSVYFDVYFNGDMMYGIDTGYLDDNELSQITKSSLNGKTPHESLTKSTYDFYELIIDYFYGLKQDRKIESGAKFLSNYKEVLNSKNVNKQIYNVVNELDDLHTSHIAKGFYKAKNTSNNYQASLNDFNTNVTNFYNGLFSVQREAVNYFGLINNNEINFKEYEILDEKTATIYLNEFVVESPKKVEAILKALPSTVENVIMDLSYNTGGNLGAVLRIFVLMTNENISYHSKNPLTNATATYSVKGENPAYDKFNYIVKTSSVTFSAANLMSSMAKELNIPVIGKKSSGGASSISFYIFPQGSIINMSSNMVLCKLVDGKYESIEYGIEVDYQLTNYYNKNEILNVVNNIFA